MDWAAGSRWQKAMVISLLLHSIVLTGVGWLAGQALLPEPMPETLIELELTDGTEGLLLADTESAAAPTSQGFVPDLPQPTPVHPVPVAEPVVAASDMAVVAVDNGAVVASAPVGDGGSGGTSAGSSVSGGSQSAGGGSGKAGGVIPPGILSRREPNYPERARQAGIEGTVVLKIEILASGHAGQVSVLQSSGSELLDEAAAAAVQRWRFVPAKMRETGQSIACQTTMPMVFKLKA